MKARTMARLLLVGLASLAVLAGCAADASPTAVSFGPVTVVTGTAKCPGMDITNFDWTTDPDGTKHVRDDHHANRCTVTTNDPRASGLRSSTWNIDLWGDIHVPSGVLVQWGTARLENAGGRGRVAPRASAPGPDAETSS